MLPRVFASLLFWDKVLIVLFILFSVFLITSLVMLSMPEIRRKAARKLLAWAEKLKAATAAMRDDEPYDPEWMDAKKWRQTRP